MPARILTEKQISPAWAPQTELVHVAGRLSRPRAAHRGRGVSVLSLVFHCLFLFSLWGVMISSAEAAVPVANDARFPISANVQGQLVGQDDDGDALTYKLDGPPSKGAVEINSTTGAFIYIPTAGLAGNDSFTFKVNDGVTDSAAATVKILPTLTIGASLSVLVEGNAAQTNAADISIRRLGDTDKNLPVVIALSGTATESRDYSWSIGSAPMNAASSLLSGTLTVVADEVTEGDEEVTLTLVEGDDYIVASPGSVTIIIQDGTAQMPKANFQLDQMVQEGNTTTVRVDLSEPAQYPVRIPFTLSSRPGTQPATLGADFTVGADATVMEINVGESSGQVTLHVLSDGLNEPTDETVVLNMGQLLNARAGNFRTHTVTITEKNIPAKVMLRAEQGGKQTRMVTSDGGLVTVTADVSDINQGQLHTYVWSLTNNNLVRMDSQANSYVFDPSGVPPGFYKVRIAVTDNNLIPITTRAELQLKVAQTAPSFLENDTDADGVLDADEGYGDSDNDGVQNYYDKRTLAANVLQQQTLRADLYLMTTRAGLSLRLGDTSMATGRDGALVTAQDIASYGGGEGTQALNATDVQINSGGYYDFEVHDLTVPGMSVLVVIPQTAPIPEDAVYRKYTTTAFWHDYTVNSNNQIYSAAGELGTCPAAGDASYAPGLNEGHYCVQLLIQDGGPNDADGEQNFVVKDPGGLVSSLVGDLNTTERGVCGNLFCSQGGSGALGWAGLSSLLLAALISAGRSRRTTKKAW